MILNDDWQGMIDFNLMSVVKIWKLVIEYFMVCKVGGCFIVIFFVVVFIGLVGVVGYLIIKVVVVGFVCVFVIEFG